jgi:hypothetical protein
VALRPSEDPHTHIFDSPVKVHEGSFSAGAASRFSLRRLRLQDLTGSCWTVAALAEFGPSQFQTKASRVNFVVVRDIVIIEALNMGLYGRILIN